MERDATGDLKTRLRERETLTGSLVTLLSPDVAMAREYVEQGFSLIALGMDAFFLWQSAQSALEAARGESLRGGV